MKVGFHLYHFGIRGTEIAVFDYATIARENLGCDVIIFCNKKKEIKNQDIYLRFKNNFPIYLYKDINDLDNKISIENVDVFYVLKSGKEDKIQSNFTRTIVQAVFPFYYRDFHGSDYITISKWLSEKFAGGRVLDLPHLVKKPSSNKNLRSELKIPKNAIVFGSYGGSTSFDIDFVKKVILEIVNENKLVFFIFMNYPKFANHDAIIFLDGNTNIEYKEKFVNSSDFMLHARKRGETFGLSCAEFEVALKPVLTYSLCYERAHIDYMKDNCHTYSNPFDLKRIIQKIIQNPNDYRILKSNYYKNCNEKEIAKKLKKILFSNTQFHRKNLAKHLIYELNFRIKKKYLSFLDKVNNSLLIKFFD